MLAVTFFFPPSQIAFYSVAAAIQSAVVAVARSVGMRWFSQHKDASVAVAVRQTTLLSVGGSVMAMVLSWPAISIAYGRDFLPAFPVALILCTFAVPMSIDFLVSHVAMAREIHSRIVPVKIVVVAVGFVVVGVVAAFGGTIVGAAIAVGTIISLGTAVQVRMIMRGKSHEV
ncbi:hypothetical protein [Dietzia sp. Die43]|uniref:hypothetical protein n=1 Tax=Dietzia sp. Die43 TaxID=2926011 RepID=UPI0021196933|nr:hypothetical protein [Dietzia sp. Die43]